MQGTIDTLKHELVEAQQMRGKDAEKHRREKAGLQESHEALIRFAKVKLASPFDPLVHCPFQGFWALLGPT